MRFNRSIRTCHAASSSEVFGLVDDSRAVLKTDDLNSAAEIVRIRKLTFDADDPAGRSGLQKIATDGREVVVEARQKFARCLDPLARDRSDQAQQDRLIFKQAPKSAGFHLSDELIVPRRRIAGLRLCGISRQSGAFPRLREPRIERRRQQAGYLFKKRKLQTCESGVVQIVNNLRVGGSRELRDCLPH